MRFLRRTPPAAAADPASADPAAAPVPAVAAPRSRTRRVMRITVLSTALFLATSSLALAAFPTSPPVARSVAWLFGAEYLGRDGVVIQQGDADCGIAALQMALERRGVPRTSLDSARAAVLARGGEGASLLELKRLSDARGVPAEGWRMGLAGLVRAPMPVIVHLGDHFAVVDRILSDGRVEMRDPSLGRLRMSATDFRDIWTGNALVFPLPGTPRAAAPDPAAEADAGLDGPDAAGANAAAGDAAP